METWKAIAGYEGRYEISSCGRVKSLITNKILTPKVQNKGRLHIILSDGEMRKSYLIHRLVAEAFIPCNDRSLTINHIDENPQNNCVENLEWCTLHENMSKYLENHPEKRWYGGGRKEKNPIPIKQIAISGEVIKIWRSPIEIKKALGFSDWSIKECCKGNRKTAYGYKWQFAI